MHKGPDTVRVKTKELYRNLEAQGVNMEDELEKFQIFRYLSAGEAMCRIFGYDLSNSSVGCTRLTVHLEGMDWVGEDAEGESKLLQYFKRPAELARLLYLQYYSRYSIQKATAAQRAAVDAAGGGLYKPRGRGNAYFLDNCDPPNMVRLRNAGSLHVARMYPVPVTQGELYYLRKLLTVVPGTSFPDMRAFNGETYATYREAAEARGIVGVEEEYSQALGVVASSKSRPSDLRHTFVVIAVTGGEGVPVQDLYRKFRYFMAMDLDVRGRIQPPGRSPAGSEEECAVYRLLPVREYVEGLELDLDTHPVHEYHLLRVLEDLLDRNYSRTLENVGLPTLASFAAMKRGGAVPAVQLYLETYLGVGPRAVEPTARQRPHIDLIRNEYSNKYSHLLTGEHLQELRVAGGGGVGQGHVDHFFNNIDKAQQDKRFKDMYATLNSEQREFVDMACVGLEYQVLRSKALFENTPLPHPPDNANFLHLQARGGRGKSYVTTCVIAKALSLGLVVCVSSFAGIAAILLPLGQTCHRTYGLPLDVQEKRPSSLTTRSVQGRRLAHASVHIIDEFECFHKNLFEEASAVTTRCSNDLWNTGSTDPFGGAFCLLVGDRHQTLPINKGLSNDQATLFAMVRASPLFDKFTTVELFKPQRTKGDKEFDAWLATVSVNRASGPVEVPPDVPPPTTRRVFVPPQSYATDSLDAALTWLFGPVPPPEGPFPVLNPRYALLTTLNETVDQVNDFVLDKYVDGEPLVLDAAHELSDDSDGNDDAIAKQHATLEYMRGCVQSGVPSATLRLKKGCVVILVRNLLSTEGLVNGTKLLILNDPPGEAIPYLNILHVQTVPPPGGGKEPTQHWLPRFCFELFTPGGLKFIRRQFPVRLAYSLTGQKSQGQTILRCVADVRRPPFAHGVSYVQASRCTDFGSLCFLHAPTTEEQPRPTFVNYVIQQALAKGVIGIAAPVRADPMEVEEEEGSEEEEGEDQGRGERQRQRKVSRVRNVGPKRATLQANALSLRERREYNHNAVKDLYINY